MGGISVGSFLGAKYAKNSKNPLLYYSITELIIGITGLFYHNVFINVSDGFFNFLLDSNYPSYLINITKILLSTIITIPSAILLGATFPFVSTALIRSSEDKGSKSISLLYFFNSLGACVSVIIASYYLIPSLGTQATIYLAGICNIIIATLFFLLSKNITYDEKVLEKIENNNTLSFLNNKNTIHALLIISLLTGLSSFIYEVSWIRLISLVLGSSTHYFDIMISTFILGLAFGGLFSQLLLKKAENLIKNLSIVQIIMGIFSLSTIYFYEYFFILSGISNEMFMKNDFGYIGYSIFKYLLCVLIMFPTTFFAGMTLPIITYYLFSITKNEKYTGTVYGWNTIGAIIGAGITGLFLIPIFQLKNTLLIGAVIDISLGVFLLFYFESKKRFNYSALIISLIFLIPAFFTSFNKNTLSSGVFRSLKYSNLYIGKDDSSDVIVRDGKTATISFHKSKEDLSIKTNGKPDALIKTDPNVLGGNDEITMSSLAFYPMTLQKKEYTASIIGLGSGMTAHNLLSDPLLKKLDLIEIEEEIYNLAKNFLPHNRRLYEDKRVNIIFDDAKTFFYSNRKKYDLIISEPSNPWVSGVSSLFTDEFYKNTKKFLNKDGFLVQWVHKYEFSNELLITIIKSMDNHFPFIKIYNPKRSGDLVIIASDKDFSQGDFTRFENNQEVKKDINEINDLSDQEKNISFFSDYHYITSNKTLKPILEKYNSNSDFFPIVDTKAEKPFFLKQNADSFVEMFYSNIDHYQSIFENDFDKKLESMNKYLNYVNFNFFARNLNILSSMANFNIDNNNIKQFNSDFYITLSKTNLIQKNEWKKSKLIDLFRIKFSNFPKEKLIFDLVDANMNNNIEKIKLILPEFVNNISIEELNNMHIRILVINAFKISDKIIFNKILEKFVLKNQTINTLEKEYIYSLGDYKFNESNLK